MNWWAILGLTLGCTLVACGGSDNASSDDEGAAGTSDAGTGGSAGHGGAAAGHPGGGSSPTAGTAGTAGTQGGAAGKSGAGAGGTAAGQAGAAGKAGSGATAGAGGNQAGAAGSAASAGSGAGSGGSGNAGSGNAGSGNAGSGNAGSGNAGSGNAGSGNAGSGGSAGSGNSGGSTAGSGNAAGSGGDTQAGAAGTTQGGAAGDAQGGAAGDTQGGAGGTTANGDCCTVQSSATCAAGDAAQQTIESCVCAQDPYCCTTQWDDQCVGEVDLLSCGMCPGAGGSGGSGGAETGGGGQGGAGAGGVAQGGAGMGGAGGSGQGGAGATAGMGGSAGSGGAQPPPCLVTICLNGAYFGDPLSGGNGYFDAACKALPGIVSHCKSNGNCYSSFEFLQLSTAEDALFNALDTNGDGFVDEDDKSCQVRIAGYSWGGVNAEKLANRVLNDDRYADSRKHIHRMAAIDPYQPTQSTVDVPSNVEAFWEFRHSVAPADDCSSSAPFGPYKGLPPRCHAGAFCFDYDYSLNPNNTFPGYSGAKYQGKQIDHCWMADVGGPPMISLFADKSFSPAPKSVPVTIY